MPTTLCVALGHDAVHRFAGVEETPPERVIHLVGQRGGTGALVERVVLIPERSPCVVVLGCHRADGDGRSFLRHFFGSAFGVEAVVFSAGTSSPTHTGNSRSSSLSALSNRS